MRASTSAYLHSMRRAISDTLLPELRTDDSKRAAHILLGSIDELAKRETVLPALLAKLIPIGVVLAQQLFARSVKAGLAPDDHLRRLLAGIGSEARTTVSLAQARADLLTLDEVLETLMLPCLSSLGGASEAQAALSDLLMEVGKWKRQLIAGQMASVSTDAATLDALQPLTPKKLTDFLRRQIPGEPNLVVEEFRRLSGGMSKETFLFNLRRDSGAVEEFVIRKDPSVPYLDLGCFKLSREFEFVNHLFKQGFPLPEPLWLSNNPSDATGDFYVMRRIAGGNTGGIFSTEAIPVEVMLQMAQALAQLHRTPLSAFKEYIDRHKPASVYAETSSDGTRRFLLELIEARQHAHRTPDSAETYLLAWALQNIPRNDAPSVPLHGDFTPHNCLWKDGRLVSVIDWECADFGDPVVDLAYLRPHIAARMDWNLFLRHYELHLGRSIDRASFDFYATFLHLRTLVVLNIVSTRVESRKAPNIVALHIDYEYVPALTDLCLAAATSYRSKP